MLSIGKLTAGREGYYLDLAARDDYYLHPTEQAGRWHGALAAHLDLAGPVDPDSFRAVLAGLHPATGAPLSANAGRDARVTGFDLTFSAPKSVSVLWTLGTPEVAASVAEAHDRAVADALAALEAEAVAARRGHAGAVRVTGAGVVGAGFGHRTSRAGDPQLHTHMVVANMTVAADGRWSALDGRSIYQWATTVSHLYQAALRHHLTADLGVRWSTVDKGIAEIAGITRTQSDGFSTRRSQITAELTRLGLSGPAAAQTAALATRAPKRHDVELDTLRRQWAERAAALGLDTAALTGPGRRPPVVDPTRRLLGPDGLTATATAFDRRGVLRAVAAAHPDGLLPADARILAGRLLAHPNVVALGAGTEPPITGRRSTTVELLAVEARMLAGAAGRASEMVGVAERRTVAEVLADRPSLTSEQQEMVASLVTSGAGVQVVVGRAGTGKTYALDAARAAWVASGHTVIGAALAARAAAELQAGAGIPATTVARLLGDLERPGPAGGLAPRTVVVVDEAGMVGTRTLDRLLTAAARHRAKVVLVGDPRQLPEIDAGGSLAALTRTVPTTQLALNRRQDQQWERDALDQLRSGSVDMAVDAYSQAGRLTLAPSADAARQRLVEDWAAARAASPDKSAATAARPHAPGHLGKSDLHWVERAQALLAPLLHAAAVADGDLALVLSWLHRRELLHPLSILQDHRSLLAADVLEGVAATDSREQSGIFSTADGLLAAYRTDAALATTRHPNFDPHTFARSCDTVYLVAPSVTQALYAPLVVALLEQIRTATYQARPPVPMLWCLDELAGIAPLPDLPATLAEGASQGVVILACLQDLSQARARWGAAADGFLTLFTHKLVLPGIADTATLRQISALAGDTDIAYRSTSRVPWSLQGATVTTSTQRRPRLPPDAIATGQPGCALWLARTTAHLVRIAG